jgi:hypothetical protein
MAEAQWHCERRGWLQLQQRSARRNGTVDAEDLHVVEVQDGKCPSAHVTSQPAGQYACKVDLHAAPHGDGVSVLC